MEQLTANEFAKKVKEKYPEYKDTDNETLARAVVEKYPEYAGIVRFEEQPGIGRVATGLAADIAVSEGSKYAGAAGGTVVGGPVGSGVGYLVGAIGGGISGSLIAQKIEGREEVSYGRVVADTLLNLLPGGLGKTKKTLQAAKAAEGLLPKIAIAAPAATKYVAKRGAVGAAVGTTAMSIEKGIDEDRWLTPEELMMTAATSASLNIGLGLAGEAFARSYKKFAGKPFKVLDKAYKDGDHDAISVVENLIGTNAIGRGKRELKMLQAKITPATTLGPQIFGETQQQLAKINASADFAATVSQQVKRMTKNLSQEAKDQVDDYIFGRTKKLPTEVVAQREILDTAKEKLKESQKEILNLYMNGRLDLHEDIANKIANSIETGDYSTREYRFFEDPEYRPSAEQEQKLRKALAESMKEDILSKAERHNERIRTIEGIREKYKKLAKEEYKKAIENKSIEPSKKVVDRQFQIIENNLKNKATPAKMGEKERALYEESIRISQGIGEKTAQEIDFMKREAAVERAVSATKNELIEKFNKESSDLLDDRRVPFTKAVSQLENKYIRRIVNRDITKKLRREIKKTVPKRTKKDYYNIDGLNTETINRRVNDVIQQLNDSRTSAMDGLNFISSNKRIFRKRKDLIPELKEYLGEYTESDQKIFGTLNRVGRVAAEEAGNAKVVDSLLKTGMAKIRYAGDEVIEEGMRPLVFGKKIQKIGDGTVYVDEITQRAIKELHAGGNIADNAPTTLAWLFRTQATATGLTKFMRVPANWASYTVQPIGNMFLAAMHGINPFRGMRKGINIALTDLNSNRIKSGKTTLKELSRYKELGLIDGGVSVGDIRNSFNAGFGRKFIRKPLDKIGKLYNVADTAQRIAVYENWKGKIPKLLMPGEAAKLTQRQLEEIAAELTNTTYMNYSRINKNLKSLSKYGVLNEFVAFNLELGRTTYNQARMNKAMVSGEFAKYMNDVYGIKLNQKALVKEGIKRTAAMSAILGAGSAGVTIMNRTGGISEDTENASRESLLAPWEQDQAVHIRQDGNKFTIANMSYQVPTAELTSIAESATRGESFTNAIGKAIDSAWSKFGGSLPIHLKNLVAAVTNQEPNTGDVISKEKGLRKLLGQASFYFKENFTPGTVRDIRNADKRSSLDNWLRWTMGYRSRTFTIQDAIGYKFRDIKDRLNGVRSDYSGSTFSSDNVDESYAKNNETYRRIQSELIRHVDNLRKIGVNLEGTGISEQEIETWLKDAGIGKQLIQDSMQGKVSDMSVAIKVNGDRKQRISRYVEIGSKLSDPMLRIMLEQEYAKKKITRSDALAIIGAIKLKKESN